MIGQRISRRRRPFWRLLFILLAVLIIVLALVNLGVYVFRALDQPPQPAPGELVYATTFDAFNDLWAQFPGQVSAQIADGELVIASDGIGQGAYSDLERTFGDFDLRVDVTWGDSRSRDDVIVVLFRSQNADNHYAFKIRSDGAYSVEHNKDGKPEVVSAAHLSPHIYTDIGSLNQVRIVAKGATFTFFLNDVQLPLCLKGSDRRSTWTSADSGKCLSNGGQTSQQYTDSAFAFGRIALGAISAEPGLKIAFDNVLIYGPQ
jgi:hypothetical protein